MRDFAKQKNPPKRGPFPKSAFSKTSKKLGEEKPLTEILDQRQQVGT